MSYAIESKKRKFDRILESLTDGSFSKTQPAEADTSLNVRKNVSGSRVSSLDSLKRRRITPTLSKSTSHTSLLGHYLPSSRAAFLERLETFRHITKWHIPSTISINAAEWAKRGWICADVDTVSCSSCLERVTVDLTISAREETENAEEENPSISEQRQRQEDENDMMVEIYEALVKRYNSMITTSHTEGCPWRKRGCDSSIQRIEGLLNTSSVVASTKTRVEALVGKIDEIPFVLDLPSFGDLPVPRLESLREFGTSREQIDALKLAICGWQYKEADVIECKNCFRSLGLWLYRGVNPTIENLDSVESHLEYCPWRSPEAQDTDLLVSLDVAEGAAAKTKLPGWVLVYHALKKHSLKKKVGYENSSLSIIQAESISDDREQMTPEQREKKMKDLMRRIKEIKKPFNVKGLLRKKDRSDT